MKNVSVISLPECTKCEEIKAYLKESKIPFTEKTLNSEIQTNLIMNNIYYNPPVLVVGDKYYSYKDFQNKLISIVDDIYTCDSCPEASTCCQK